MDRFDMENELINLNKISDDLKTIASQIINGTLDRDDVFSALHGLAILHDARYNVAWDTFLQVFNLEQYSDVHVEINDDEDNSDLINDCDTCNKYIKGVLSKYNYPVEDKNV